MPEISDPVWLITGCSSGFGRELARQVLEGGGRAVLTARNPAALADLVAGHEGRALALALDVTYRDRIAGVVEAAEARFGGIDVLVNNAGYGYRSTIEEGLEEEIRALFDTNVFGLFAVTRAVLPGMRARKRGHVINISSILGLVGLAGSGYYAASKFAVEGFSDALAAEVAPLGIAVTCVEPGPFRTGFTGGAIRETPTVIPAYAAAGHTRASGAEIWPTGWEPGDPARAAAAIIGIAGADAPPLHYLMGGYAVAAGPATLQRQIEEMQAWRAQGLATDFPPG